MSALYQLDVLGLLDAEPEAPRPRLVETPTRRTPVRAHMRRMKGSPPPSVVERRDAALVRHAEREAVRVAREYVRARLLDLYRARAATDPHASVSADDADVILRAWAECPPEIFALKSQAWRGTLFTGGAWTRTGARIVSTRPGMHAHDYPTWRPTT